MSSVGQKRIVLALISVGLILSLLASDAFAWPWKSKKEDPQVKADLAEVLESPGRFLQREVVFNSRFALHGNLYKHFHTRFTPAKHANLAVWPVDAMLWDKQERRNVLPTLYVDKNKHELFHKLKKLSRYDAIEVEGIVRNTYARLPWIEVTSIKILAAEKYVITEAAIVNMRQGLKLSESGEYNMALKQFEMAIGKGIPEALMPFAMKKVGQCKLKIRKYDEAAENLGEATKLEQEEELEKDAQVYLDLAKAQLESGNAKGTLASCRQALEADSMLPEAHNLMAEAYGKLGDIQKAMDECDVAKSIPGITLDQKGLAEVSRARVMAGAGRYADAVRAYAKAIGDGQPLQTAPWLRMEIGKLYEGRFDATKNKKHLATAAREYGNATAMAQGKDPEALYLQARAEFKGQKGNKRSTFNKATGMLDNALLIDESYIPAKILKVKIAAVKKDPETAEKMLLEIIEDRPNEIQVYCALAKLYVEQEKNAEAREAYRQIIKLDNKNRKALVAHADLSMQAGDHASARDNYSQLVILEPGNLSYRVGLGEVLLEIGEYDNAIEQLGYGLNAKGDDGRKAALMLGQAYAWDGKIDKAEKCFRDSLVKNPSDGDAMVMLAWSLVRQDKNGAEAVELASAAVKKDPKDSESLDILGWACIVDGKYKQAAATLAKVPEVERFRRTWYHIGLANYEIGKYTDAIAALIKASEEVKGSEHNDEARKIKRKAEKLLKKAKRAHSHAMREMRKNEERVQAQINAQIRARKKAKHAMLAEKERTKILEAAAIEPVKDIKIKKEETTKNPEQIEAAKELTIAQEKAALQQAMAIDSKIAIFDTAMPLVGRAGHKNEVKGVTAELLEGIEGPELETSTTKLLPALFE